MKVTGLEGDYCPTCAGVLASVMANPKRVIVMCGNVCHSTLQASGDYDRLDNPALFEAPEPEEKPEPKEQPKPKAAQSKKPATPARRKHGR